MNWRNNPDVAALALLTLLLGFGSPVVERLAGAFHSPARVFETRWERRIRALDAETKARIEVLKARRIPTALI